MMRRCPVPHCGGRVMADEDIPGRRACHLAGHVAADPEPSLIEKLVSNATPEAEQNVGPRVAPDLTAITARVMAAVAQEAHHG